MIGGTRCAGPFQFLRRFCSHVVHCAGHPANVQGAGEQNPEALTAQYNQAMQAKDWPRRRRRAATGGAKSNVTESEVLGNAQLYSGSADAALATYDQAMAAAEKEKPAKVQAMSGWKDSLSQIYIGKGNALLRLKRNAEAIEAYNQSAEFASNQGWRTSISAPCSITSATRKTRRRPAANACRRTPPGRMHGSSSGRISLPIRLSIAQGKVKASPETREALEKYLALAPDGPHAADVKAMLEMLAK